MMKKKQTGRKYFWQNPRFRYGSVSTLILCIFLAALVAFSLTLDRLEKKHGWRGDYSFNAVTTQSEATLQVLAELPHPVHIYALFTRGQEDAPLLELLDRYAAASPLVTWEKTDVGLNPGLLTRFRSADGTNNISNDSLIVFCEETGRWKVLSPGDFISLGLNIEKGVFEPAGLTYEAKITSALRYVTQETIPRILLLQGHGELNETETAVLAELWRGNHYDVQYISLRDGQTQLQPEDLLAILSPVRDLTEEELLTITDFAAQGGGILFTSDYTDPVEKMPNYQALLRSYGFLPREGLVMASHEEPESYYNRRSYIIPTMQSTDMTLDLLLTGNEVLLMPGARAFAIPEENDRALDTTAVLTTGYKSYLKVLTDEDYSIEQTGEDEIGPFALALQAQRVTETGNVSRAFVLGCSTLLTDAQIHAMTSAQEFILRMTEYLLNTAHADLNIMAKAALRPQLSVESVTLGSLLLVALPLSVLVAALLVLLPRRR